MCILTNMLLLLQPQPNFLEEFQSASCVPEISRKHVCRRHGHHEFSEAIRWSVLKWKIKESPCWVRRRVRLGNVASLAEGEGGRKERCRGCQILSKNNLMSSGKRFGDRQHTCACPAAPGLRNAVIAFKLEVSKTFKYDKLQVGVFHNTCNRTAPRLDEWLSKRRDMGHPWRKAASTRMSHDSTC